MIEISGETGQVIGLISFCKHLCLGVDLGAITPGATTRMTTLIDPLAQRPGPNKDVFEIQDDLPLNVPSCGEGREYLQQVINKEKPNPVEEILIEHREKHMNRLVQDLLPRLISAHEKNAAERLHHVRVVVDEQGQRILNLLIRGIEMMLEGPLDLPTPMLDALKQAIIEDSSTKHGLAEKSMGYLILAKSAVVAELIRLLDKGSLNEETLALLFGDGMGIAIATKPVVHAVIRSIDLTKV